MQYTTTFLRVTLGVALLLGAVGCQRADEEEYLTERQVENRRLREARDKAREAKKKAGDLPAPPDVAAPPADAKTTASGLAYKVLQPGKGTRHPKATETVEVHYTGWMTNGSMFDSSVKRGTPASFPLNGVIKGWTEGLQLMVEGEKTRFWIPAGLAYGETPSRPGGPSGMLVFDVELLAIK